MNRQQKISQVLLWEEAAKRAKAKAAVYRQQLDEEARAEYESQGSAPTWRFQDIGTVTLPVSQETVYVADEKALLEWCKATPGENVVETVERVMPWYVHDLLIAVRVENGQVLIEDGEVVPGLAVRPGGVPQTLRFQATPDAKAFAGEYADKLIGDLEQQLSPELRRRADEVES